MILGGTLYAGANVAPSQTKGALLGYGMGMIIGGIVGVLIAQVSPFIINLLTSGNFTSAIATTTCAPY